MQRVDRVLGVNSKAVFSFYDQGIFLDQQDYSYWAWLLKRWIYSCCYSRACHSAYLGSSRVFRPFRHPYGCMEHSNEVVVLFVQTKEMIYSNLCVLPSWSIVFCSMRTNPNFLSPTNENDDSDPNSTHWAEPVASRLLIVTPPYSHSLHVLCPISCSCQWLRSCRLYWKDDSKFNFICSYHS